MAFQLVKSFSSLNVTVLFLMSMDELVYSNSASDQGAIAIEIGYQLWSKYRDLSAIAIDCEK